MPSATQRKLFNAAFQAALRGAQHIALTVPRDEDLKTTLFFLNAEGKLEIAMWLIPESPKDAPERVAELIQQYGAVAAAFVSEAITADMEGVGEGVVVYGAYPAAREERCVIFKRTDEGPLEAVGGTVPHAFTKWLYNALPAR